MKRCELRCYGCSKIIGYASFIDDWHSPDCIDSTRMWDSDKKEPILCPTCEAYRLKEEVCK